jgi:hypothetical protein
MSKIKIRYIVRLTDGVEMELSEAGGLALQEDIKRKREKEFVSILGGKYQVGDITTIYPIKENML